MMKNGWSNLMDVEEYRHIAVILLFLPVCISFFTEPYSGVLRRGWVKEFVQTVKDKSGNIWERCQDVEKEGSQEEALTLLKDLICRFLQLLCGDEISRDMKTIFFTEYSRPTAEFSILYDGLIFPVFRMMAALLTQASGGKIAIKEAYLYMFPLFSQLFVFASRQETICSFMEWNGYGKKEMQKLQEYMSQQIDFLLNKQK